MRTHIATFAAFCLISCSVIFAQGPAAVADDSLAAPHASAATQSSGTTTGNNGASTANSTYVFPSNAVMRRYWLKNTIGPRAYISATLRASWMTWVSDSPREWDKNFSGWSKRFGTTLLENGLNQTALVGLSKPFHQDPRYERCTCTRLWPRTKHALLLTVVSRDRQGNDVFAVPKIVSPFVGPMVTRNTIYPDRYNSRDAATAGASYFLGAAAWNMVREFLWKGI